MRRILTAVPAMLFLAVSTTAAHAAQRVYVASSGVDTAPCTLAQPCRSFAAAHAAVDAGGEIVALDAAGYGALTITKSVTVTANPGVFAGIAAATGVAVTIDAPGSAVTLRNLQINGTGGQHGVMALNGARLAIENCVISNFLDTGINASATDMAVVVTNTASKGNAGTGIWTTNGTVVVADSSVNDNFTGLYAHRSGLAISDSLFVGNRTGMYVDVEAVVSIARAIVSHSAQVGIAGLGGSIVVGESQVTHNGTYGFMAIEGTFASRGNNQLTANGVAPTVGTIAPAPAF